jgi:hypothetical protein
MPRVRKSTGRKMSRRSKSPKRASPMMRKRRVAKKSAKRSPKRARRTGSKRVANRWVQHIKSFSRKYNMTYKQALMDPKVRAAYKSNKSISM